MPVSIAAGALFTFAEGKWSDYGVVGIFRAKSILDTNVLLTEYVDTLPKGAIGGIFEGEVVFNHFAFIAWLFRKDLVEQVSGLEWYLGEDSDITGVVLKQKRAFDPHEHEKEA